MLWIALIILGVLLIFGFRGLANVLIWVGIAGILNLFIPETRLCFLVLFAMWGVRRFREGDGWYFLLTLIPPAGLLALREFGIDVPVFFALGFAIFIALQLVVVKRMIWK